MTRLDTLKSLQKRIQEATGPDRELDWIIANTFKVYVGGVKFRDEPQAANFTSDPDGLGACVALMREVLPEAEWVRLRIGDFVIWRSGFVLSSRGHLANDCLTFIDAIVSALIAEEQAKLQEKADV